MRRRRIRRAHTARHTNRKSHTADSGLSCKGRLVSLDQLSAPSSAIESLARARDGRVRVLGIGSTTRMPELPDRALAYLARHDHIAAHHARELAGCDTATSALADCAYSLPGIGGNEQWLHIAPF